jgi:hypothetical protein
MLGWGVGLVFQYIDAYMGDGFFSEQKEYEKLYKKKKEEETRK